jgi:hypothetical protein
MDEQTLKMFEMVYESQKRMSDTMEQLHELNKLLHQKVKLLQVRVEVLEQQRLNIVKGLN